MGEKYANACPVAGRKAQVVGSPLWAGDEEANLGCGCNGGAKAAGDA